MLELGGANDVFLAPELEVAGSSDDDIVLLFSCFSFSLTSRSFFGLSDFFYFGMLFLKKKMSPKPSGSSINWTRG